MKSSTAERWFREIASWFRKLAPSPTIVTMIDAWANGSQDWRRSVLAFLIASTVFAVFSTIATWLESRADRHARRQPYRLNRRRDSG